MVEIHKSALKHGYKSGDIEHAVRNAIAIDHLDENLVLYIGPSTHGGLLEVIAIQRSGLSGLAIHAMTMRAKHQRLLPREGQ